MDIRRFHAAIASCIALCVLQLFAVQARAQENVPGVTSDKILIGSCSALEGPASFLGMQTQLGALAYFHVVNDAGGVHGRTIELQSANDGYDPDKAPACFNRLSKDVFAMGFFVGTPTAAKYVPMADAEKIPVVGLFTGAQMLYEPMKRYIINVRASYFDETREQIDGLWTARGVRKIAVLYQDDAFGKAVLDGVQHALAKHDAKPIALGTFPRNTLDVAQGIKMVREAKPEAVILVGPYAPVAAILKAAHAEDWDPLFLTVSFVGTEGLVRAAEKNADGIIITQVVPAYDRTDLPTIKLYRSALEKYMSSVPPSFVSLEGFVDAMVLVEGLKRAGRDLNREKLINSLESIHNFDVGLGPKFLLDYGPKDHKGFNNVYATILRNGHAVEITDWKNLPAQ
jgi:branched-chain amino acid transport system substrate-binding protein